MSSKLMFHSFMLVLIFFVHGCSWNQKDFLKGLWGSKSDNSSLERAGVSQEEMDKFKVEDISPAEEPAKITTPASEKKKEAKIITKKTKVEKVKPVKVEAPLVAAEIWPKDYPEELKKINEDAKKIWSQFRPRFKQDSVFYLNIDYLGMTVGKIAIFYKGLKTLGGNLSHHFHAGFKSAPFYSAIYELDDKIDTYVDKDKFLSYRFNLVQRESSQSIDDVQLYDREKLMTTAYFKQKRSDKLREKKWEGFIPYYSIDALSALFLFQGLPLKKGDSYSIPVVNKGKVLLVHTTVENYETIETKKGKFPAIRVHALTQYSGDHLKSGDITIWFADNETRDILRVKAKIKLGSVFAEIADGEK